MENYKIEFQGEGTPQELIEQLKGLIENIEEYKDNPAILDGFECSKEDGYPETYLISQL